MGSVSCQKCKLEKHLKKKILGSTIVVLSTGVIGDATNFLTSRTVLVPFNYACVPLMTLTLWTFVSFTKAL